MVWRFLKHYGMSKATDALEDFATAVVAFDPEAASRAQIDMMEAELHKLGRRLAEAEAEVNREHRETAALRDSYENYLQAAQRLESALAGAEGSARTELEASLSKVVTRLEKLKPEIEREEQEDQEVEAWHAELQRSFGELGEKLRQARGDLQSARRKMDIAKLRKERAAAQDSRAAESRGIAGSIASLSVALDAMNQQTASYRNETESLRLKAGLFQTERLEDDPHIAAALEAAQADGGAGSLSLSQRLAALEGQPAKPALTAAE